MAEAVGASGETHDVRFVVIVAVVTTLACVVGCWRLGSPRSALFGLFGAGCGVLTQGVAVGFLLRNLGRATVGFLGAFALASLFRVLGGALVVLLAFVCEVPERAGFFAGLATLYVALEVVMDVLLIRSLKRVDRTMSG